MNDLPMWQRHPPSITTIPIRCWPSSKGHHHHQPMPRVSRRAPKQTRPGPPSFRCAGPHRATRIPPRGPAQGAQSSRHHPRAGTRQHTAPHLGSPYAPLPRRRSSAGCRHRLLPPPPIPPPGLADQYHRHPPGFRQNFRRNSLPWLAGRRLAARRPERPLSDEYYDDEDESWTHEPPALPPDRRARSQDLPGPCATIFAQRGGARPRRLPRPPPGWTATCGLRCFRFFFFFFFLKIFFFFFFKKFFFFFFF
jgi:hypothetical protein